MVEIPNHQSGRSYCLGFTPLSFDIGNKALSWVYDKLASDSDLISHHFDEGVPWPEALAGKAYHQNFQADLNLRKGKTPPGHKVLLSITPIHFLRDRLAPYRGASGWEPLPPPWDRYDFDHADVKTAYLNHALNMVAHFEPDFLVVGIEVNMLKSSTPDRWSAYLELHKFIYAELKQRFPGLPVMVSLFGVDLLEGYSNVDYTAQIQAFREIIDYTDYYTLSFYPHLSKFLADTVPADMFTNLLKLSDKPAAFAESGYPAQTFSLSKGTVKAFSHISGIVDINGSPQKQTDYVNRLLHEVRSHDVRFVVNFVLRDYNLLLDAMYSTPGHIEAGNAVDDEVALLWCNSGLYDGEGNPRPSLDLWKGALALPYVDAP